MRVYPPSLRHGAGGFFGWDPRLATVAVPHRGPVWGLFIKRCHVVASILRRLSRYGAVWGNLETMTFRPWAWVYAIVVSLVVARQFLQLLHRAVRGESTCNCMDGRSTELETARSDSHDFRTTCLLVPLCWNILDNRNPHAKFVLTG